MDYRRVVKTVIGRRGQKSLSYYRALLHKNPVAVAIRQLVDNKKFHDIHQGKRCFILGNGPSLKQVDLNLLRKEQVFTVNYFTKMDNYRDANTNYHFWMDSVFWGERDDMHEDMGEVLRNYEAIGKENCECFLPVSSYAFLKEKGLLKIIKPNFLYIGEKLETAHRLKIDISNIITTYTTVVQYAITVAIYMGFSEIYLLGCDSTNLMGLYNEILGEKENVVHAYKNDNAGKQIKEIIGNWSMSKILYDQYLLFLGYERLYQYCKEKGISLRNCSNPTAITSIPRIDLEKVLFHNKSY